jgi:hypothetical protein
MAGSTAPVTGTGPVSAAITDLRALRKRVENMELALKRLQSNRNPQSFAVADLTNAKPMSKVLDGQTLVYSAASGTYEPGTTSGGGYLSLTGPGETGTPGALTQLGPFTVTDASTTGILLESDGRVSIDSGATSGVGISLVTSASASEIFIQSQYGQVEIFAQTEIHMGADSFFFGVATNLVVDFGLSDQEFVTIGAGSGVAYIGFTVAFDESLLPMTTFSLHPAFGFTQDGHIYFTLGGTSPWTLVI